MGKLENTHCVFITTLVTGSVRKTIVKGFFFFFEIRLDFSIRNSTKLVCICVWGVWVLPLLVDRRILERILELFLNHFHLGNHRS